MVRRLSELPMLLASSARRSLLAAGVLVLGLSACGRRGALEPPPDPAAIAAEQEKAARREKLKGGSSSRSSVSSSSSAKALEGESNAPGQAQIADLGDADEPAAEGPAASPT